MPTAAAAGSAAARLTWLSSACTAVPGAAAWSLAGDGGAAHADDRATGGDVAYAAGPTVAVYHPKVSATGAPLEVTSWLGLQTHCAPDIRPCVSHAPPTRHTTSREACLTSLRPPRHVAATTVPWLATVHDRAFGSLLYCVDTRVASIRWRGCTVRGSQRRGSMPLCWDTTARRPWSQAAPMAPCGFGRAQQLAAPVQMPTRRLLHGAKPLC